MPYDEKETEEYIENLGIEYRFSCFHERDPEGETSLNKRFVVFKFQNLKLQIFVLL